MSLFCHLNESRNVDRMFGNIQFSQLRLTYLLLKIRGKFFFFHFLFVYVSCNSLLLQWNQHTRLRDQYSFFSFSAVVFVYIRRQKKKKKADGNKKQESTRVLWIGSVILTIAFLALRPFFYLFVCFYLSRTALCLYFGNKICLLNDKQTNVWENIAGKYYGVC